VVTREEGRARTSHDKMSWFVLVTHRLGLPSHGSPLFVFLPLRMFLHRTRRRWAHIPKQGRGTGWASTLWLGASWGGNVVVVVVVEGGRNQASTVDAVDG